MNVVMNDGGGFIELQGTAEGHAFRRRLRPADVHPRRWAPPSPNCRPT
jgi:hypothetical protein